MNKLFVSALCILLVSVTLKAQNGSPLINSGDVLKDAEKLYDDGKYKDAIGLYSKISRSDTNYAQALRGLSLSANADSSFDAGMQYAQLGLKLFPQEANQWYSLIGNNLSGQDKKQEALVYFNKIIANNPNSYLAWFNRGVMLFNMDNIAEAKKSFQRAVTIHPYHSSSHYFLGKIYVTEGNLPAAMMCYATCLAVNPGGTHKLNAVNALSAIAHVNDEVAEKAENVHFTRTADNFAVQQEIITSKAALDKKYKLQTDVEDPITRQLQALCEKLEYNKNDTGFCMQYYVPFFKDVLAQNKFNLLVFFMFSGLDVKQVQEFTKRHKKDLEEYVQYEVAYFNTIKETQVVNLQARQTADIHYLTDDGIVSGKGAWKPNGKENLLYGPWEFYYDNGTLRSKGVLNDQEKKDGEWVFYYRNGQMKEHSTFVNGEVNGKSTLWFDNGNMQAEINYKNGKEDGEKRTYYYNGLPKDVVEYKDDKKDGPAKGYKSTGELNYYADYKNDVQDGQEIYYHPNGKVASQAVYANGKANGPFKKFAENGTVILQGAYVQDKQDGAWKTWYPTGKLKEEYTYQAGNLVGEYKWYAENGKLRELSNYTAGKEDGKQQVYTEDGRLTSESNFENGRIRELKFFDEKGNVLVDNTTRNGAGTFTFYNAWGSKTSEASFTKDGDKDGPATEYFEDGKTNTTEEYKKGERNGLTTHYFYNGNINDKLNYTAGKEDGYYTSFYYNKNPRYQGWFVDGDKQADFITYNILGDKINNEYYKDGEVSGYDEYFNPNGKKDYEDLFDEGWLKHITQFDSTGKVVEDVDLPKGDCDFTFYYNNGKPYIKASYRNYHIHGRYDALYPDGSTYYTKFYKQGLKDSVYKEYFYGGKLKTEGAYSADKKQGLWKVYHPNGKLRYDENYVDDELQGKSIFYNEDGTKTKEYNYRDNSLDGQTILYGDSNKVAIVFNYYLGRLLSYTYQGKDGKLVEPIVLKGQTGNVTAYYKNGTKSAVMSYVNGYGEGMRTLYYSNGKVYTEGERQYGDYHGVQKTYALNGQIVAEENYNYDNLHGTSKYWYTNGKIKSEQSWYNGNENGTSKYYDETGKLAQTRFYYYGQLEAVQ